MAGQTYATHVHRPIGWLVAWAGAVLVTGALIWAAVRSPSLQSVALVFLGVVTVLAIMLIRMFALRLQDRIIRLEMQVRFARLGLERAAAPLSLKQLVALRFASDAELPALVQRAAAEHVTPDQIKRAITDWQPDLRRT